MPDASVGNNCAEQHRCCSRDDSGGQVIGNGVATEAAAVHAEEVSFADAVNPTMRHRLSRFNRSGLIPALFLALMAVPLPSRSEVLYTLKTQCSQQGAAPVACSVEAVNDSGATLYRHRIGTQTQTIRITDKPIRMAWWDDATKQWRPLSRASARFSSNTVCFNGGELCVVNPNYLNSVREDNVAATTGRDLVKVNFGADGRINASCYDAGCEVILR